MDERSTSTQTHLTWREREQAPAAPAVSVSKKRIPAALCGIFLGALGVHKFVLGYTKEGLITLVISVVTVGWGAIPMGLVGLIEGIVYLTKSDSEFAQTYVVGRRGWF
jgi:TM2 domain-containing membrane protein YozV